MPKLTGMKLLRLKKGWPLRVVATELGVSETLVSKWENKLRPMSEKYLGRLTKLYGVGPERLLEDLSEEKNPVASEQRG